MVVFLVEIGQTCHKNITWISERPERVDICRWPVFFPSVGFLWCCKQTKINLHHLHRTGAIKNCMGLSIFMIFSIFVAPVWGSCFNEKKRRKQNCHVSHCSPWESDGALGYSEKAAMNFSTCCTTYWFHTFLGLLRHNRTRQKMNPSTSLCCPSQISNPGLVQVHVFFSDRMS